MGESSIVRQLSSCSVAVVQWHWLSHKTQKPRSFRSTYPGNLVRETFQYWFLNSYQVQRKDAYTNRLTSVVISEWFRSESGQNRPICVCTAFRSDERRHNYGDSPLARQFRLGDTDDVSMPSISMSPSSGDRRWKGRHKECLRCMSVCDMTSHMYISENCGLLTFN